MIPARFSVHVAPRDKRIVKWAAISLIGAAVGRYRSAHVILAIFEALDFAWNQIDLLLAVVSSERIPVASAPLVRMESDLGRYRKSNDQSNPTVSAQVCAISNHGQLLPRGAHAHPRARYRWVVTGGLSPRLASRDPRFRPPNVGPAKTNQRTAAQRMSHFPRGRLHLRLGSTSRGADEVRGLQSVGAKSDRASGHEVPRHRPLRVESTGPVFMPPPSTRVSLPRAGGMPGSAARLTARTRARSRTASTSPRA